MVVPVTDSTRPKKQLVWAKMGQNTSIKHSVGPNDNFLHRPPKYYEMPCLEMLTSQADYMIHSPRPTHTHLMSSLVNVICWSGGTVEEVSAW
jgi:hypothetical protein